jgi:transposase
MGKAKYTNEFKRQLVDLVNNGKQPIEIANEYDVNIKTLYNWIGRHNETWSPRKKQVLTDDQLKIRALEKELKQVKIERDILKQAALIFGKK